MEYLYIWSAKNIFLLLTNILGRELSKDDKRNSIDFGEKGDNDNDKEKKSIFDFH